MLCQEGFLESFVSRRSPSYIKCQKANFLLLLWMRSCRIQYSLTRKNLVLLRDLPQRGEGVSPNPKGFLHTSWICFFLIFAKWGGEALLNLIHKAFCLDIFDERDGGDFGIYSKGGGVGLRLPFNDFL